MSASENAHLRGRRFVTRSFDVLCALVLGAFLLPLTLIVLLLLLIRSPGNPFYLQKRMGRGGKTIRVVKFRTMKRGASLSAAQEAEYRLEYKLDDDPRLIGYRKMGDGKRCFGALLRRTSLDELPQLYWNVLLCGNMSLVGPRPILAEELQAYYTDDEQKMLLSVKPGVTGYWQAYARGHALYADGERQRMELYYVTHRSLRLDLKILFRTVLTVISKAGAK
ncbi:MAG: sugar transferase [Clostridia bacterium]|nr:sugar transferase [Clostridia bacterium]